MAMTKFSLGMTCYRVTKEGENVSLIPVFLRLDLDRSMEITAPESPQCSPTELYTSPVWLSKHGGTQLNWHFNV